MPRHEVKAFVHPRCLVAYELHSRIKLWREDSEGRSLWPRGEPLLVRHRAMRGVEDIVKVCVDREIMSIEDKSREYKRCHKYLVFYWRGAKAALEESFVRSMAIKDGFWPSTRIFASDEDQFTKYGGHRKESIEDDAFVEELCHHPLPSFRVGHDVFEGYFLAIRPTDGDSRPI